MYTINPLDQFLLTQREVAATIEEQLHNMDHINMIEDPSVRKGMLHAVAPVMLQLLLRYATAADAVGFIKNDHSYLLLYPLPPYTATESEIRLYLHTVSNALRDLNTRIDTVVDKIHQAYYEQGQQAHLN